MTLTCEGPDAGDRLNPGSLRILTPRIENRYSYNSSKQSRSDRSTKQTRMITRRLCVRSCLITYPTRRADLN